MNTRNEHDDTHGKDQNTMNESTLRQALRSLPRAEARPGFAGEVMARLPERSARRRWLPWPRPAFALASVAAVLVLAVIVPPALRSPAPSTKPDERVAVAAGEPAATEPILAEAPPRAPIEPVARAGEGVRPGTRAAEVELRHLLVERRAILAELQRFRHEAQSPRPMLYLGGDESVDLVVDLSEVARRRPQGAVQPAAYRRNS